jgi:hypothetical protein
VWHVVVHASLRAGLHNRAAVSRCPLSDEAGWHGFRLSANS